MIHITNGQSEKILDYITDQNFFSDTHRQSLKDNLETFEFTTFADKSFSEYLTKRNRVIIPAEDQGYIELIINEVLKFRDSNGLKAEVYADASYLELKKAKVMDPQSFKEQTATTLVSHTTNGTEWRPGSIEGKGIRTMHIEKHTTPYAFLKRIATEFGLELRFRVETNGNQVTGRYVDLLERIGVWRGREVEFGKDLIGIQRREKTDNVFTALKGLGPEKDDGTRLEVIVTDEDALQRWGKPDSITGELQHLWDTYEPQSADQEMTESRLRELTGNELEKRVNEVVEYESTIADLEYVPGMENKKIRFGDTIKIKDTKFNPPLYLEARVHTQERSIKDKSRKKVVLGDYIEYTEEQVQSVWLAMRAEIRRRLARMIITNIASTAGDTFKNGEGSTELTAEVFLSGDLVDEAGEMYSYVWNKRDKNGIPVTDWNKSGKTISITADEIDEKATYTVDVTQNTVMSIGRITITNVYDGQNGEQGPQGVPGPPGEDGQTLYTWVKYADDEQGNGMSDYPDGKEYMGIAYNKITPTKGTNPIDYTWSKTQGKQGIPGEPGADGTPRYNWVKYADDKNGNGMSDDPEGKRYLGLAYNKISQTESNNASDYEWSLIYRSAGDNLINNPATTKNIDGWSVSTDGTISVQTVDFMGEQVDVIESISTGNTQNYSEYFDVDPTKAYEVSAWFKVEFPNPSTHLYLGATSDPGTVEQALISDESWTDTTNFYFFYTSSSTFASDWVKITGYMLPTGFPAEKANGLGENNSRNMRFKNGIDRTRIRFLNWNNDGTPRKMWVAHPTVREVPDTLLGDFNKKINDAYSHADVVSEAAYLDAIADAEAYLEANGLIKGRDYNGVSITNEDGFVTARGDGLVRTVSNSTLGYVIQRRSSTSSPWQNVLYFDTNGNIKYAGELEGATGTFKGAVEATDFTAKDGDFFLEDNETGMKYTATPKRNIVKDHSFELVKHDPDSMGSTSIKYNWLEMRESGYHGENIWMKTGSPKVAMVFGPDNRSALPIFGEKAICVRDANFVRQVLYDGIAGGMTFTASGFFKRQHNVVAGGKPRFEIDHLDAAGGFIRRLSNTIFPAVPDDYSVVRHSLTFTIPDDFAEGDSLDFKISGGNNEWVQCDGIQIVEGTSPSVYMPEDSTWEIAKGSYNAIGRQPTLWAGNAHLRADDTIYPAKPITDCRNGWIFVWSYWSISNGSVGNSDWQFTHIPKHPDLYNGGGHRTGLRAGGSNLDVVKYYYIYHDRVVGHNLSYTGDNRYIVLREILEY